MDILEEEEDDFDIADVVLCPPEEKAEAQSDCDSDDSDEPTALFDHLPRRLLASGSEATLRHTAEDETTNATHRAPGDAEGQPEVETYESGDANRSKKRKKVAHSWTKTSQTTGGNVPAFQPADGPSTQAWVASHCSSAYDFLRLFLSDEFLNIVSTQTMMYATQKGLSNPGASQDSLLVFFGILLLSGYNKLPYRRMYWREDPDVFNELVSRSMRRDVFESLLRSLHLANNQEIDLSDPYYKVRPMFKHLNESFKMMPSPEKLSIDETMVPYYGRHHTKQYIRGKPVRFGYKLWCCSTTSGYLLHAEPYCGKATNFRDTGLGQGANVVLGMVEKCDIRQGQQLFFDNLFTSVPLLKTLSERKIGGTGTLRQDRKAGAPLPTKSEMGKRKRGEWTAAYSDDVALVTWHDNQVVTVASNVYDALPTARKSRWNRKEKKVVQVEMPGAIQQYNQAMGGVDLFDQSVAAYRIRIRSKKWWWPLLNWGVNAAAVKAWMLKKMVTGDDKLSLLDFIREAVTETLFKHGAPRDRPGRPLAVSGAAAVSARADGRGHWPEKAETRRGRCRHCGRRSAYSCVRCCVPVHPECMAGYHASTH